MAASDNKGIQKSSHVLTVHGENRNISWIERKSITEIQQAQCSDPIIGKVLRYKETYSQRPTWQEISIESSKFKTYWSNWDNLFVNKGILYFREREGPTRRGWYFIIGTEGAPREGREGWHMESVPTLDKTEGEKFPVVDKKGEVKVPSLGKGVESGGHHRLVLPEEWYTKVFHELHSVRTAGHLGIAKTLRKVGDRFFWAGYAEDIRKLVRNCPQCVHKQKPQGRTPMKLYHSGAPMERIAMDILGPLPETYQGNKYVLCIGNYFTKWMEAIPLPDQEARTIAEALIESIICRFGIPLQIHTDQGRNFQSALLLELC